MSRILNKFILHLLKFNLNIMKKEKEDLECTISTSLFKTMKLLRRYEDAKELTEQTGFSRPTIDKALNYGHIRDVTLEKAIVEFYKKRANWHRQETQNIINLLIIKK